MDEQLRLIAKEEMRLHSVKFTMDDIARKMRMSKSTLYQKASSKEDLIRRVCQADIEIFDAKKEKIWKSAEPVRKKFLDYCRLYVESFWDMPDGFYHDLELHYGKLWDEWIEYKLTRFDWMISILEEGVKTGELRAVNLPVLRIVLITATKSINEAEFLKSQNMTGADVMNALEDIILNGVWMRKDAALPTGVSEKQEDSR